MGKITFRADDALISRLEEFDASKSEIMRDALREYIESRGGESTDDESRGDERIEPRVDAILADLFDRFEAAGSPPGVNVTVTLEGSLPADPSSGSDGQPGPRHRTGADRSTGPADDSVERSVVTRTHDTANDTAIDTAIDTRGDDEAVSNGTEDDANATPDADATPDASVQGTAGSVVRGVETESCPECGEPLTTSAVYCRNCGSKATNRLYCECGDELSSDWSYCPSCGRRTASAEVLENG